MSGMAPATTSASGTTRIRPQTHKPRGICIYYNAPRGCFAGDKCKFLHGEPSSVESGVEGTSNGASSQRGPLLTPYDQSKRCLYYAKGFCKRGEECWFQHVLEPTSLLHGKGKENEPAEEDSDAEPEAQCSICYEKPATYGLLPGCNHVFCIACIREWRDRKSKSTDLVNSGNNKRCPMCRESSNFITPSSVFLKHGSEEKGLTIAKYKESMAKVQCRYFERTKDKQPMCPYGKDCFYKHEKADGTLHVFQEGASVSMRRYNQRRRPTNSVFVFTDSDADDARIFGLPFDLNMPFLELFNPAMALSSMSLAQRARRAGNRQADQLTEVERSMGRIPSGSGNVNRQSVDLPLRSQAALGRRQLSDTVQDIGRSLEVLNEALNTGATLDRISTTVQGLQDRLRQETHDAVEDGASIERLQVLANQMLASIEILQTANARTVNPFSRSPTPSEQPLPHPFSASRSRSQTTGTSASGPATDGIASDDDMPELQSISNSSEEDYNSDSLDDSEDEEDSVFGFFQRPAWDGAAALRFERESTEASATSATAGADEPPPLVHLFGPEYSTHSHSSTPIPGPSPSLELPSDPTRFAASPPPPFLTDGRGRVVWTSTDSAESPPLTSDPPSASAAPPASPLTAPVLPVASPASPSTPSRLRPSSSPSTRKSVPDGT